MTDTPATQGAHHIGLTVPELTRSRAFFIETLGYSQVGEVPDYPAVFLTDGTTMITLWQATDLESVRPFDRKTNVGLHHFALKVGDEKALDALHAKLQQLEDVEIEFPPEPLGDFAWHMMCAIPGGIRMSMKATEYRWFAATAAATISAACMPERA